MLIVASALALIAALTLRPSAAGVGLPFFCLFCGSTGSVDFILNVFLFVPLGVGLHLLLGNTARVVASGFVLTLVIEALQWRAIGGRDAALGDIAANSLGAWLGAILPATVALLWRSRAANAKRYALWYSAIVSVIVTATAFLLLPGRDTSLYRVQWMVTRTHQDSFSGTLHSATLNSTRLRPVAAIRSGLFTDTIHVQAVISGADSISQRGAEILRVATIGREALLLGQQGDALVFRTFTNASRFRFRSVLLALHGQFPVDQSAARSSAQTVIDGRSARDFVSLSAMRGPTKGSVTLRRTIGLGWTLILPWNVGIGPAWWPASALWLCLMVFPASFLTARATQGAAGLAATLGAAWVPALLIVCSLVAVPMALGLSSIDAQEWSGVALGIAAGILVARWAATR